MGFVWTYCTVNGRVSWQCRGVDRLLWKTDRNCQSQSAGLSKCRSLQGSHLPLLRQWKLTSLSNDGYIILNSLIRSGLRWRATSGGNLRRYRIRQRDDFGHHRLLQHRCLAVHRLNGNLLLFFVMKKDCRTCIASTMSGMWDHGFPGKR